jgi:peroxiredoxin
MEKLMRTTPSTATSTASRVLPGQAAPELDLPIAGGGRFRLSDSRPRLFTMIVFNRGLHCPVCRAQLSELNRRIEELAERGIEIVSVSGETAERAERMRTEWGIARVRLAYAFTEPEMRAWGLFVSHAITDDEPPVFNEPGLFLIRPDGTIYYESILSMPVGRPRLGDLLDGIAFWTEHDYPARGSY